MEDITFVIIDNSHLTDKGINYLCNWVGKLILVTTNSNHPVFNIKDNYNNLEILYYEELSLSKMLEDIYSKYNCDRLTIQSGGTLNGMFIRENLIDYVNIVVAPIIVGGFDVSTLVDGKSIKDSSELNKLRALELLECNKLNDSYVQLKYKVRK